MSNLGINTCVTIHPVVLFEIVSAYERRNKNKPHVFGSLLGQNDRAGSIVVKNCFSILFKEGHNQLEVDLKYFQEMYDTCTQIAPNEQIVGWFTTNAKITEHACLLHNYYKLQCEDPILLTCDTLLKGGRMDIKAYVSVPIGVPGGTMGVMFTKIPVVYSSLKPELTALSLLQKSTAYRSKNIEQTSEFVQIREASMQLDKKLSLVLRYINDVLRRRRRPDSITGRKLMDLINSVPLVSPEEFAQIFNKHVCDLLMSLTLSTLVQTQLMLHEKLLNFDFD